MSSDEKLGIIVNLDEVSDRSARLIDAAPEMYQLLVHIANDPDVSQVLGWRRNIYALLDYINGKDSP